MAYDNTGATVGAAGHDAATLVAAMIVAGGDVAVLEEFITLRDAILANSLEVQDQLAASRPVTAQSAPKRSYGGGSSSGQSSGGPAGGSTDIRSGKYVGKTVAQVVSEDRDYAEWAAGNMKNDFLRKAFIAELEAVNA